MPTGDVLSLPPLPVGQLEIVFDLTDDWRPPIEAATKLLALVVAEFDRRQEAVAA
jgi:hypothetical protein